jgi:adenosylcobinamide kinase/adenosylcobinamide-phosphate guanylyltransferase
MQRPTVLPMADHLAALPQLTLVLGGARSGKSAYAEGLVAALPQPLYLATAEAGDGEMSARIRTHQDRRGPAWTTVEEPLELLAALDAHARPGRAILVDCLTLWVSNLMLAEADLARAFDRLVDALPSLPGSVVFVANEVGLGIVPDNALARAFRDHAGSLNQRIAARCQRVIFVAAGLPLLLKDFR